MALAIADFSNDHGIAFPAISTLAKKARLSPRQVKRAIDHLNRLGELAVYKKKGPSGVNIYRILLGDDVSLLPDLRDISRKNGGRRTGEVAVDKVHLRELSR